MVYEYIQTIISTKADGLSIENVVNRMVMMEMM